MDLTNSDHRKFFEGFLENGKLNLVLLAESTSVRRTVEPFPNQLARMKQYYQAACEEFREFQSDKYDFEKAVQFIEKTGRLPEAFSRVLSERELLQVVEQTRQQAEKAPPEIKAQILHTVGELHEAITNHCPRLYSATIDRFDSFKQGALLVSDMRRTFGDDSKGVQEFLANGLAGTMRNPDDIDQFRRVTLLVVSLGSLLERLITAPEDQQDKIFNDAVLALADLVNTQRLSLRMLKQSLLALGISLGDRPGRIPRDYSLQFDLRSSGHTWTEITRRSLVQDPEIREEFAEKSFDELDYWQRESLKKRIQEGVKSHARRTGRQLPRAADDLD